MCWFATTTTVTNSRWLSIIHRGHCPGFPPGSGCIRGGADDSGAVIDQILAIADGINIGSGVGHDRERRHWLAVFSVGKPERAGCGHFVRLQQDRILCDFDVRNIEPKLLALDDLGQKTAQRNRYELTCHLRAFHSLKFLLNIHFSSGTFARTRNPFNTLESERRAPARPRFKATATRPRQKTRQDARLPRVEANFRL